MRRGKSSENAVFCGEHFAKVERHDKKPHISDPMTNHQLDTVLKSLKMRIAILPQVPNFPEKELNNLDRFASEFCRSLIDTPAKGCTWIRKTQDRIQELDKKIKDMRSKYETDEASAFETIKVLYKYQTTAEFWIEKVLPDVSGKQIDKIQFAKIYASFMHNRWKTNEVEDKKVRAVLTHTCAPGRDSLTIEDFVIFLERFGPFPDSLRKASALINYDTDDKMVWFSPTGGSDNELANFMKENGIKWMVRPSSQATMRNAVVCSVGQDLGGANIRIFNSPQGYFVQRNKGRGPTNRFDTIVDLIEHELYISFHDVSVEADQKNIKKWHDLIGEGIGGYSRDKSDSKESKYDEGEGGRRPLPELRPLNRENIDKLLSEHLNPGGLYVVNKNHAQKQGQLIEMRMWNKKDVIYWVHGFGKKFEKHAKQFEANQIDGDRLTKMTQDDIFKVVQDRDVSDLIFQKVEQHKQSVKNGDFAVIKKYVQQ